jgi:hypothetical protein
MFSAFQGSAFQSNAFQIVGGGPPVINPEAKGGFDERAYKKYRESLEALTKATSVTDKYPKKAIKAAQELADLPIESPQIEKLAEGPQTKKTLRLMPEIDYEALAAEIMLIRAYIDGLELRIRIEAEQDDEAAIMLLMH